MKRKLQLSSSLLQARRKSPPLYFYKNGYKYTYVDDKIYYALHNSVAPNAYQDCEVQKPISGALIGCKFEYAVYPTCYRDFYEIRKDVAQQLPAIHLNITDRFSARQQYKLVKRNGEYVVRRAY